MSVDCVLAEEETPRDVAIRETLGYETEHLELSPAQDGERRVPDSRRSRRWNDAELSEHVQCTDRVPLCAHRLKLGVCDLCLATSSISPPQRAQHGGEIEPDARSLEPSVARGEEVESIFERSSRGVVLGAGHRQRALRGAHRSK